MPAVPGTQSAAEPEQQQAQAKHHSSGASHREHSSCREVTVSSLAASSCFWVRATHVPPGHVAQAMRWHEQPRGKEGVLPCASLRRCCVLGAGSQQPWGGDLWAASPGPLVQQGEVGELHREPSTFLICLQGCECLECLPGHADTATVLTEPQ